MVRRVYLDQIIALALFPFVMAILAALFVVVVPLQGRPFLFSSERMRTPKRSFRLLKIRTMHAEGSESDQSALGGDQCWRVTPIGRFLRSARLDELPQIINVVKGELRFIGPRPPLGKYVQRFPDLYGPVLAKTPPGITGLATVMVHKREERLLKACRTAQETEDVYQRRCIPIKARIDMIYAAKRSWRLDTKILWMTLSRLRPIRIATSRVADKPEALAPRLGGRTANTVVIISGNQASDISSSKAA